MINALVMRALAFSFVALMGCDNVFRLTPLPDPPVDGRGDASDVTDDAMIDASTVGCPAHYIAAGDLDTDGVPNAQDLCPFLASTTQEPDADADGIGDRCDPHPSMSGDCILLLDTFATLGCWTAYESWQTCGSALCTPSSGATITLINPIPMDTGEIAGTFTQIANGGPFLSLVLNDSQPGEGLTGAGCEVVDSGGNIGTSMTTYAADAAAANTTYTNMPLQASNETPVEVAVAWGAQPNVSPYYQCTSLTSTTSVPVSSGTQYPFEAPGGMQASIRTNAGVFKPQVFIAYGIGASCN